MNYNFTSVMKDVEAKIMEDIKIWKMFRRENFCGKNQKDFIHTRESVERLLFLLKIKYSSRLAFLR